MNVRHPMCVLHSFSIKNIFYDKMDLRLFYFNVTIYEWTESQRCIFVCLTTFKTSTLYLRSFLGHS